MSDHDFPPGSFERISHRKVKALIEIVPPQAAWPQNFQVLQSRLASALGDKVIAIHHTGSTSIFPGIPAKDVIDIDVVVPNITDEASYVPALEDAGFQFLIREPHWHEHRLFVAYEPQSANVHVWGPDCSEVERHRIFRDWVKKSDEDRQLYVSIKEKAARQTKETGGDVTSYNKLKEEVIRQILRRAFKDLGYID